MSSTCTDCGAPLRRKRPAVQAVIACGFCGRENAPPPTEKLVPVPVQVVNTFVQSTGEAKELRCPHCGKRLVTVRVSEVDLNGCGRCGGIWVDNKGANKVVASPEKIFGELAKRAAASADPNRRKKQDATCPSCPVVLEHVTTHGIEIDICGEHGTWFDALELDRLTAALRGEVVRGVREPSIIKCVVCKTPVQSTFAVLSDVGPSCDACWRSRQREISVEQDVQIQANGAGVLIGVTAAILGALVAPRQ